MSRWGNTFSISIHIYTIEISIYICTSKRNPDFVGLVWTEQVVACITFSAVKFKPCSTLLPAHFHGSNISRSYAVAVCRGPSALIDPTLSSCT